MKKYMNAHRKKEEGSAMLITTIILMVLMVITATALSVSGMQFDLAILNRNTSNTYYLAKSAVEKQVDAMNKAVETQLTKIVKEMNVSANANRNYITQLVNQDSTNITYDNSTKQIKVKDPILKERLQTDIYNYLIDSYKTKANPTAPGQESIKYTIQSDRLESDYNTEIEIVITDKDGTGSDLNNKEASTGTIYSKEPVVARPNPLPPPRLRVVATATTKSGTGQIYDQQTVEGIVSIQFPDNSKIKNEIHEKYDFIGPVPELLKGALISYSDVYVKGELNVTGNVYVGGTPNIGVYNTNQYPEADENGGVFVNGGTVKVTGNLYTTRNVLATSGAITVTKDLIAHTLGIVDDFYEGSSNQNPFNPAHQVQGASIGVSGNVMVDNDVMIDRWVKNGKIIVAGSIFGVNYGSDPTGSSNVDPNQSSGVFSQGPGSLIKANRMFVAGQPFITLATGMKPIKLWESIGEPFEALASYEGYKIGKDVYESGGANNSNYLLSDSPFNGLIETDKIETDFSKSYAVAGVSGIDTSDSNPKTVIDCKHGLTSSSMASGFFNTGSGATIPSFDTLTVSDPNGVQSVISDLANYYSGAKDTLFKNISIGKPGTSFNGLRGYMTVMRSLLYKGFAGNLPEIEPFVTAIDSNDMPTVDHTWTYATPIAVQDGGVVDISDFYVKENGSPIFVPYPSIIINRGNKDTPLTIKAGVAGRNVFKGIIISRGPIEFDCSSANITINGTVIVGGPETIPTPGASGRGDILSGAKAGITVESGIVNIINDPINTANDFSKIILDFTVKEHEFYRSVLDMLYMTDYADKRVLAEIMDKQGPIGRLNTKKALKYTKQSILEVSTEGIEVAIKSLKRIQ